MSQAIERLLQFRLANLDREIAYLETMLGELREERKQLDPEGSEEPAEDLATELPVEETVHVVDVAPAAVAAEAAPADEAQTSAPQEREPAGAAAETESGTEPSTAMHVRFKLRVDALAKVLKHLGGQGTRKSIIRLMQEHEPGFTRAHFDWAVRARCLVQPKKGLYRLGQTTVPAASPKQRHMQRLTSHVAQILEESGGAARWFHIRKKLYERLGYSMKKGNFNHLLKSRFVRGEDGLWRVPELPS